MFLNNKYTVWYHALMAKVRAENRRRTRAWQYHKHHEIPKCLGGTEGENLLLLTPREHYIAHLLLTRMTEGDAKRKMYFAFFRFTEKDSESTSLAYTNRLRFLVGKVRHTEASRFKLRLSRLGKPSPRKGCALTPEHREKLRIASTGRVPTPETIEKIRKAHIGRKDAPEVAEKRKAYWKDKPGFFKGKRQGPEAREKVRKANLGKTVSEEVRKKRSATMKGRRITWGDKISAAKKGKPVSDAVRKMRREEQIGRVHSEATRAKMRESGLKSWERRRNASGG